MGLIGFDAVAGRLDQDARVHVKLRAPAYCFLIAFNPDGRAQLCYPESPTIVPPATAAIDYPEDSNQGFALTDGVGTQLFVVVASSKPLPSYAEWSKSMGLYPGSRRRSTPHGYTTETDSIDTWNAATPSPVGSAAVGRRDLPLPSGPQPGVEAIRAVAFPVKPAGPREEEITEPRITEGRRTVH